MKHGWNTDERPHGVRRQSAAATALSVRTAGGQGFVMKRHSFSLAPGFSRVFSAEVERNRFNGFAVELKSAKAETKPLKRLCQRAPRNTRLKPGANGRGGGRSLLA